MEVFRNGGGTPKWSKSFEQYQWDLTRWVWDAFGMSVESTWKNTLRHMVTWLEHITVQRWGGLKAEFLVVTSPRNIHGETLGFIFCVFQSLTKYPANTRFFRQIWHFSNLRENWTGAGNRFCDWPALEMSPPVRCARFEPHYLQSPINPRWRIRSRLFRQGLPWNAEVSGI